jgi:hypothetical protein
MPLLARRWRESWVDFRKARMVTGGAIVETEERINSELQVYIVCGESQSLG